MSKISGFVEWLPEQRIAEQRWMDEIRRVFESYGFCSIETPAVEEIEVLLAKGETDKEIYALKRLQEDGDSSDARLGLHYDLTVPLARYVAEHYNDLIFPFKRYQVQRVWRGERPQEGRFREFYQCDIDVIFQRLGIVDFQMHINNRKILEGYLRGLGIDDANSVIRVLDKLDKIGRDGVLSQLQSNLGLQQELASRCLALASIRTFDLSFVEQVRALGIKSDKLDEGLEELAFVIDSLSDLPQGVILADLSIARGFDYYTGTVYEGKLVEFPSYGTICAGGRYDDLASAFINHKLPGVGISLGLTRLFAALLAEGRVKVGPKSPAQVLVVFPAAGRRDEAIQTAKTLRERGFNVEMYHSPGKIAQQMRYASRKGIPYVWFPPFEEGGVHEVKNMSTEKQAAVDPRTWEPWN